MQVTEQADQAGLVRAEAEQYGSRTGTYHSQLERADSVQIVLICGALDLDLVGADVFHLHNLLSGWFPPATAIIPERAEKRTT
jgi:hypothetical protein